VFGSRAARNPHNYNKSKTLHMYRRAVIVSMFLAGVATAPPVHAVGVTTYGIGLQPCSSYLDARQRTNTDQVAYLEWLGGYFSGVNKTSNHRNNILGLSGLRGAMYRLDDYCRARPLAPFAEAAGMLILSSKPGPAHAIEVATYGSEGRSCRAYLEARTQQDMVDWGLFRDWLGGYLSGVNAMSLGTNDILGNTELTQAVYWLDRYCSSQPTTVFGAAADALVAETQRARTEGSAKDLRLTQSDPKTQPSQAR
jgi:hypothetical protein